MRKETSCHRRNWNERERGEGEGMNVAGEEKESSRLAAARQQDASNRRKEGRKRSMRCRGAREGEDSGDLRARRSKQMEGVTAVGR